MKLAISVLRRYAIALLVAVSLPFPTIVVAKASSDRKEVGSVAKERAVLDVEHRLLQARVSTDNSFHKDNFADEAMYMHSSGRVQNKAEVLQMVAERPWIRWSKSEQEVQIYGDIAVTHSLLSVWLTDNRTETVRATGVYVSELGNWHQVSWQSSSGKFVGPVPNAGK